MGSVEADPGAEESATTDQTFAGAGESDRAAPHQPSLASMLDGEAQDGSDEERPD